MLGHLDTQREHPLVVEQLVVNALFPARPSAATLHPPVSPLDSKLFRSSDNHKSLLFPLRSCLTPSSGRRLLIRTETHLGVFRT